MKNKRTNCRKCGTAFDEENTAFKDGARYCRNCHRLRNRYTTPRGGRALILKPRYEPQPTGDHSRCEPGGPMCSECDSLWREVIAMAEPRAGGWRA